MKEFFKDVLKIIVRSFSARHLIAQLFAIGLTAAIVLSGFDWWYFVHINDASFSGYFFPAVLIGAFVPIIVPLYFLIAGKVSKNRASGTKRWTLGMALGASALAGSIISSFYKALTGRVQPDLAQASTDISRQFNFGFWERGVFWGWPSSHTTIAFAMAFTLISLFPKNRALVILAFLYALYIGIGVSMSIHWFSEFTAGAIFGTVIGLSAGSLFKPLFKNF